MTARVLTLHGPRPGRPVAVPANRPGVLVLAPMPSPSVLPVRVEWDAARGLHVAVCSRCTETTSDTRSGPVEHWADSHRCDPELAALLALLTSRRTA